MYRPFPHAEARIGLFAPPYKDVRPIEPGWDPPSIPPRGLALVWQLRDGHQQAAEYDWLISRPHGLPLIIVLPTAPEISRTLPLIHELDRAYPKAILPHGAIVNCEHLQQIVAKAPNSVPTALARYLRQRGLLTSLRLMRDVEKILQCSTEVKSITKLARRLYTSRRTLGRRFESEGLPVPSHWLQFSRILHAAIRIQTERIAIFRIACEARYPDGFTMSNQMKRLTGCRPTEVRACLGWEWIVESWIRQETIQGGIHPERYYASVRAYLDERTMGGTEANSD